MCGCIDGHVHSDWKARELTKRGRSRASALELEVVGQSATKVGRHRFEAPGEVPGTRMLAEGEESYASRAAAEGKVLGLGVARLEEDVVLLACDATQPSDSLKGLGRRHVLIMPVTLLRDHL